MSNKQIATHPGTVTAVAAGQVEVKIETLSACASCQAHSRCGFAEKKDHKLSIDCRDWSDYSVGQDVEVIISQSRGLLAVALAYIAPSVLLIATLAALLDPLGEALAALAAVVAVALWYAVLYLFRNKIQSKFTFQIQSL